MAPGLATPVGSPISGTRRIKGGPVDTVALPRLGHRWVRASYSVRFAVLLSVAAAFAAVTGSVESQLRGATEWAVVKAAPWVGIAAWPQAGEVVLFHQGERGFSYRIVRECAGFNVLLLYAVAIGAYRIDWRRRLVGVVVGVGILIVANVLRLVALAAVGVHHPAWVVPAHDVGWPLFQIGGLVVLTLCWLRWASPPANRRGPSAWRLPSRRTIRVCGLLAAALLGAHAMGMHRAYARIVLLPLAPVAALLWGDRVAFPVQEQNLYGVSRLSVLLMILAVVVVTSPPRRAARPAARTASLAFALHVLGSVGIGFLAVLGAPPEGGSVTPSEAAVAVFSAVEFGLVALLVLREANRARPRLR